MSQRISTIKAEQKGDSLMQVSEMKQKGQGKVSFEENDCRAKSPQRKQARQNNLPCKIHLLQWSGWQNCSSQSYPGHKQLPRFHLPSKNKHWRRLFPRTGVVVEMCLGLMRLGTIIKLHLAKITKKKIKIWTGLQ